MAHSVRYNTEITQTAGKYGNDQNVTSTPYPTVKKTEKWESQPMQTDFAEWVSGTAFSEKEGTLEVQAAFDYPQDRENEEKALEKAHWVLVEKGKFTVKAGESISFLVFAGAPYFRIVWTQGGEDTKKLRIFARAFEMGRI
jgi:hypothetical protein